MTGEAVTDSTTDTTNMQKLWGKEKENCVTDQAELAVCVCVCLCVYVCVFVYGLNSYQRRQLEEQLILF